MSFADYVATLQDRFAFLEPLYGTPQVSTWGGRECTVKYQAEERAHIAIHADLGGPPWVQIRPHVHTTPDGSMRAFGLNEAIAIIDADYDAKAPAPKSSLDDADRQAWLSWYAAFLASYLDDVTLPSVALLDRIEARRPSDS